MNEQPAKAPRSWWTWAPAAGAIGILCLIPFLYLYGSTHDMNRLKPLLSRVVKEITGRDLEIHGAMRLEFGSAPWVVIERAAIRNWPGGSHEYMALAEQVKLQFRLPALLRKRIELKSVRLVAPRFFLETDASGKTNFHFTPSATHPAPVREWPGGALQVGSITVEEGHLFFKNGKTSQSFVLSVDRLQARRSADSLLLDLEIEARCESEVFSLQGTVGSVDSLMDPVEPWPIHLTAKAWGSRVEVKGFVPKPLSLAGFRLKIQAAGGSTKRIARFFGSGTLPELGPFEVAGEIFGKKDNRFSLSELTVRGQGLEGMGEMSLQLREGAGKVRGSLAFKVLDISPFDRGEPAEKRGKAPGDGKRVFSSEPIRACWAPWLRNMDIGLNVRAERVVLRHRVVNELNARVVLTKDRFEAKPFAMQAAGGKIQGALVLKRQGKSVELTAQAELKEVGLGALSRQEKLDGKGEGELHFAAQGTSVASLLGSLNGELWFAIRQMTVEKERVDSLLPDYGSILVKVFIPDNGNPGRNEIHCIVGGFEIKQGLAQAKALFAETDDMVVIGKGHIDLGREALDLSLKPYPKKGIGAVGFSVKEIAKAFRLKGTLAEPSLEVDPVVSAITLGKTVGGMIVLGPLGALAMFLGKTAGEGDLCAAALEKARAKGNAPEFDAKADKKGEQQRGAKGFKETLQRIEEGFRSILKQQPAMKEFERHEQGGPH